MKTKLLVLVACIALLGVSQARAAIVNYEFVPATNFTLDATGTISGSFTYNTATFAMTNINATVSGATGFDGTYTFTYAPWDGASTISFMYAADSASNNTFAMLFLEFSSPLDGSPGLVPLVAIDGYNLPGNCDFGGCSNYFGSSTTGGVEAASTPVPAALPLFATGLGALGLLGWRRKRKNAAAVAA